MAPHNVMTTHCVVAWTPSASACITRQVSALQVQRTVPLRLAALAAVLPALLE